MTTNPETGTRSMKGQDGQLRIGSCFSGIGGLELGLEAAGVGHTVYQIENDDTCHWVLSQQWPNVPRWGDIQEVDASDLPACDVLCGGFPCQDVSVANAKSERAGLSGARSGLWSHMERIIEAQRPDWVVVENVARGWKRWLPGVESGLRRLGYATLPVPLEARTVGAPHVRQRLFLLAHANGFEVRVDEQRVPGRRARGVQDGREAQPVEHGEHAGWDAEPSLSVVDDGIPRGLGGRAWSAIGNAVVPQCAEVIGWMIREIEG